MSEKRKRSSDADEEVGEISKKKIRKLEIENKSLKEKAWAKRSERQKNSSWFILLDSRVAPEDDQHQRMLQEAFDEAMKALRKKTAITDVVIFNLENHEWNSDYIDKVDISYAMEVGAKKGHIHWHIKFHVEHHSNISLDYEALHNHFESYLSDVPGVKKTFMGKPKLMRADRIEEYMTKSPLYMAGVKWKVL